MKYFLDTNIVSYFLKRDVSTVAFIDNIVAGGSKLRVPTIVYYEVLRWLIITNAGRRADEFNKMICQFPIVHMTTQTYDIASEIYVRLCRSGSIIEDMDILIAASTIEHGAILLTNNVSHFKRVDGLAFDTIRSN